jgi:hypothetical protein
MNIQFKRRFRRAYSAWTVPQTASIKADCAVRTDRRLQSIVRNSKRWPILRTLPHGRIVESDTCSASHLENF